MEWKDHPAKKAVFGDIEAFVTALQQLSGYEKLPPGEHPAWKYLDEVLAPMGDDPVRHQMTASMWSGWITALLLACREQKHVWDNIPADIFRHVCAAMEQAPMLQAIIAIKSSPTLAGLRKPKTSRSWWALLLKGATVDDLAALQWIMRHRDCPNEVKEKELKATIAKLSAE